MGLSHNPSLTGIFWIIPLWPSIDFINHQILKSSRWKISILQSYKMLQLLCTSMQHMYQLRPFSTVFYFQVKREKIWFKTCLLSVWVCKMFLRICLQNISFIFWGVCEKNIFWGVCEIFIFWGVCENIIFWGVCENIIFWGVCARWGAVSLSQPLSFTSCQWLLPLYPLVEPASLRA